MTLTSRDLAMLRVIMREEVARAFHSGSPSTRNPARGEENPECHDQEENEPMDPTNTEGAGALSSSAQRAVDALYRLRRDEKPKQPSMRPVARSRVAR